MQTDYQMLVQIRDDLVQRAGGIAVHPDQEPSWVDFFELYDPIIRKFARKSGVQAESLDECAQEVWVAILEGLEKFSINTDQGRFRSWLFSIVRNKSVDIVRRSVKAQSLSLNDSELGLPVPIDSSLSPVDLAQNRMASDLLYEILQQLKASVSRQSFLVFQLRRFEGKTVGEVAEELNMSPVFVRVCHHRVEKRFSRLFKQHMHDVI